MRGTKHRHHPAAASTPAPAPGAVAGDVSALVGAQVKATDAQWTCKVSKIDAKGEPAGDLTEQIHVGDMFHLACEGGSVPLKGDHLSLELPNVAKYQLRILKTIRLGPERGEFAATSWTPGDLKFQNPILTDGEHRVSLGQFEVNVASVIKPETNPESKPFGPWAPLFLGYPLWLWILAAAIVLAVVVAIGAVTRRLFRRRRFLAMLEQNKIAFTPYEHFNKDLRRLTRQIGVAREWRGEEATAFFKELNDAFRWYLTRELTIPVLDAGPTAVVRTTLGALSEAKVRGRDVPSLVKYDLGVLLSELRKALQSPNRASIEDATQLIELCRKVADVIHEGRAA